MTLYPMPFNIQFFCSYSLRNVLHLFFLQTDEIDGTLLGTLNGERNSQSNIDAINRQLNLSLPATPPSGLTQQQLKRRHIFAAIVSSECSYVATLQRLVNVSNSCKMPFRLLRFRNV